MARRHPHAALCCIRVTPSPSNRAVRLAGYLKPRLRRVNCKTCERPSDAAPALPVSRGTRGVGATPDVGVVGAAIGTCIARPQRRSALVETRVFPPLCSVREGTRSELTLQCKQTDRMRMCIIMKLLPGLLTTTLFALACEKAPSPASPRRAQFSVRDAHNSRITGRRKRDGGRGFSPLGFNPRPAPGQIAEGPQRRV